MPSWIEFRLACRGVLLLAQFDSRFLQCFDRTVAGALRSFWLAPLVLPYELLSAYLSAPPNLPDMGLFLAADATGYLLTWILFPMLLLAVERMLEREREVPGCIAILNWVTLLHIALQLPWLVVAMLGLSTGLATGLSLMAFLFGGAVEIFLLAQCLRIMLWQAVILTVADIALSIVVAQLVMALGRVPIPAVS